MVPSDEFLILRKRRLKFYEDEILEKYWAKIFDKSYGLDT